MLRPLDLQVLYMNLDKVGKETALTKEAQATAQANQVTKLQKEHDQGQHAVGRTNASVGVEGDTSVKVKAEGEGTSHEGRPKKRPSARKTEEEELEKTDSSWKDPELGKHVDLSG